jgi:hypothetical protein
MQMNPSTQPEALIATDQFKEPGDNQSLDTLFPEACLHGQTQIRNRLRACDPAEEASETFINGEGI